MSRSLMRRVALVLIYLALTLGCAWGVGRAGFRQALSPLQERGEADLALTVDRLTGQMQRYQDLAVLMTSHPALEAVAASPQSAELRVLANDLLTGAADRTTALNLIYVSSEREVLASARLAEEGGSLQSLVPDRVLERAFNGALGSGIAPIGPDGLRAYVFAAPSYAPGGGVRGALIVAVDIDHVEQAWRGDRPAVFFPDGAGRVFVTNRSEILMWQVGDERLQPPQGSAVPLRREMVGGHEIWRAELGAYVPDPALRLVRDIPQAGMQATALIDVTPAERLALLQGAVAGLILLAFGAVVFWAMERRRVLARANAQLEIRVAERTAELSGTNIALRREVTERQEAEAALKRAQEELVQAGKLSALGQMSAGLSHELNQPLMAIRQFAENGSLLLERGKADQAGQNLTRISELSGRMGRIIRNLRAFARQESEPARRIDLGQVIASALEMTEARLAKDGVALNWQPPAQPVRAMAGEVRLAQVLVNLISNAADAMAGSERKALTITLEAAGGANGRPVIRVRDTGPGIDQPERIFDPFYSTKEVGASEGMGLGLSISYGLVQSFGGAIRGRNLAQGGAEFSVELEPVAEDLAAQ